MRGHLKTSVPCDVKYEFIRTPYLGANCCRETIPHRAEPSRGDERARFYGLEILRCPHLVLSYFRCDDGITIEFAELLDYVLWLDDFVTVFILQRELFFPRLYFLVPFGFPFLP